MKDVKGIDIHKHTNTRIHTCTHCLCLSLSHTRTRTHYTLSHSLNSFTCVHAYTHVLSLPLFSLSLPCPSHKHVHTPGHRCTYLAERSQSTCYTLGPQWSGTPCPRRRVWHPSLQQLHRHSPMCLYSNLKHGV